VFVTDCWHDGVGPDDPNGATSLFTALAHLARGERAAIPPIPDDAAERVLHAVVVVLEGVRVRDRSAVERGVTALVAALAELSDNHPHSVPAHAWADLALGELALVVSDARVARQRFEAVAVPMTSPIALRIQAMHRLIDLAVDRLDLQTARRWSAKALAACGVGDRPILSARSRRYELLIGYAIGNTDVARRAIADLVADDPAVARVGTLLLATTGDEAGLAALLDHSRATGDTLLYALGLVVAARRELAANRLDAATALVEDGVRYLRDTAPQLVNILAAELS
jgi:hypothetical protein